MRSEGLLGGLERNDLGIDAGLAHAPRDQLRDLAAEIDDEDGVGMSGVLHGGRLKKRASRRNGLPRTGLQTVRFSCFADRIQAASSGSRSQPRQMPDRAVGNRRFQPAAPRRPASRRRRADIPSSRRYGDSRRRRRKCRAGRSAARRNVWQARSTAKVSMSTMSSAIASKAAPEMIVRAGRQRRLLDARNPQRQRQRRRQVEERRRRPSRSRAAEASMSR